MSPEKLMLTSGSKHKKQDCLLMETPLPLIYICSQNCFPCSRPNVHLLTFLHTKIYVRSILPSWKWIAGLRHPTLRQARLNSSGSSRRRFQVYKRNVRPRKTPINAHSNAISKLFSNAFMI